MARTTKTFVKNVKKVKKTEKSIKKKISKKVKKARAFPRPFFQFTPSVSSSSLKAKSRSPIAKITKQSPVWYITKKEKKSLFKSQLNTSLQALETLAIILASSGGVLSKKPFSSKAMFLPKNFSTNLALFLSPHIRLEKSVFQNFAKIFFRRARIMVIHAGLFNYDLKARRSNGLGPKGLAKTHLEPMARPGIPTVSRPPPSSNPLRALLQYPQGQISLLLLVSICTTPLRV